MDHSTTPNIVQDSLLRRYQHRLRHMPEIELARGLVGLGGMTS